MAFAISTGQDGQRFKYNDKELDLMHGLNMYDYSARHIDMGNPRFTTQDPLAEKYYSISPYAYCANNPMKYIDPTGMDWYQDGDSTYQYAPWITKEIAELLDGFGVNIKYVGITHKVKDKNGHVTEDYRKDGSIMFSNEASGYARVWNNSQKTGKEEMGVITDKGVLVVPNYMNGVGGVDLNDYSYSTQNGNVVDANGKEYNTVATVHTHPGGTGPSWQDFGGGADLKFATYSTPYKPVYVLQMNGANAISFIVADENPKGRISTYNFQVYNITSNYPKIANMTNLLNGNFSLRQYTRGNNFRTILKK
jgi:RHS repeat-associated protein